MSGALNVPPHFGVVATLVRGSQVVTIHKPGTPTFAVRAVARACDRYGWKVRTLSSPVTIYRDMKGTRAYTPAQRGDMWNDHGKPPQAKPASAEKAMLQRIGRADLLA